jgi:hypothetical protein
MERAALERGIRMNASAGEKFLAPVLFVALVLVGSVVVFARNPIALAHASMYAEDGVWTSLIYQEGGFASYLSGRGDYFVVGNMMLAHLAVTLNHLIFGTDNISRLPEVIAVVSYVFFAVVAALPVIALKSYLSLPARLLLSILVLLLPVGPSANEIFGRIVNTGFAFTFIAAMLILWRETFRAAPFRGQVLALDAIILVCGATNPIAIGITGAYLAFRLATVRGRSINDWLLAAGLLPIAIVNAVGIITVPNDQAVGVVTATGLVYTAMARPLLYPLIFPWYGHLTHVATLILSVLLIALFWAGWRLTPYKSGLGFVLFAAALTTLVIAIQRPGYVVYLSGYASSYPDRYYYAQNFLVLTAVVWTADALLRSAGRRMKAAGTALAAALLLIVAFHPKQVFAFYGLRQMAPVVPTFEQQLLQGRTLEHIPGFMQVDIFPAGWSARYPVKFRPEP